MTKAVRSRILKDANGDITDHLRNHIHLTNCIHLENHMHKQSPILADRSLLWDLIALQRSRSLRDPSASPPSWNSPCIIDLLSKKGDVDVAAQEGRRLVGVEHRREDRRLSGSSPSLRKVVPDDVLGGANAVPVTSDRSSKSGIWERRRFKREESSRKTNLNDILGVGKDRERVEDANHPVQEVVMDNSFSEDRHSKCGNDNVHVMTLNEHLNDVHGDNDKASSSNHLHGRYPQQKKAGQEPQTCIRGCGRSNQAKRRKFRSVKRTIRASKEVGLQNEMSVASNPLVQGSARSRYHKDEEEEGEEEEEYGDQNVTGDPQNGCGIPWNWSRIHHRGITFLDMAGRSLSCGLSDSKLRKGGMPSNERDILAMQVASDHSSSSTKSNPEALPLVVEPYRSDESVDNAGQEHNYFGELGIYADRLLKDGVDSDLVSEGRSGKLGRNHIGRHQNLTQKYMPRTFRDLVGQNLVSQALSNAILRKKVGFLYVFYGPHGTGKTSCARIFARALNCQSMEHPKPCGCCNSCIAHDTGKSQTIKEVGPVTNFDFQSIMDLLDSMISQLPSQYRALIFGDCNMLSADSWSAISKVIVRAPRRIVFILVSSSLEVLPHIILSRCQKFFFPKIKDADVIYTLQWIASQENIDIDKDALKLIATRSDGSLRNAEMTLEQLSLLGQRISVPLVQELIGLISDERLVDLLDLALSADTVNTVKNLRAIIESGVEPLALMSQIASVITDILAGTYDFTRDTHRRKFFRRQPISKEEMEKLRQALKILSEAEKQLRMSDDKLTWLTAALLQLAPDQQYLLCGSSTKTSFNRSSLPLTNHEERNKAKTSEMTSNESGASNQGGFEKLPAGVSGASIDRKRNVTSSTAPEWKAAATYDTVRMDGIQILATSQRGSRKIWLEALGKIQSNSIRDFLYQEGKLISVSFGAAPTVQLAFSSPAKKLEAEKLTTVILQAFESVLGSPVTIQIHTESSIDTGAGHLAPLILPTSRTASTQMVPETKNGSRVLRTGESRDNGRSEIVDMPPSPREINGEVQKGQQSCGRVASEQQSTLSSIVERRGFGEKSKSLVRGKVSLAHMIQQAEGCTQQPGLSKHKAVSIAEKLEQENLRLEPRSRDLLCWKASKVTRRKRLYRLKIRNRRRHSMLRFVSCGNCVSSRTPR